MGNGARIASVVGFTQLGGEDVLALGGQMAVGHRVGPLTFEAELDVLGLSEPDHNYDQNEGQMLRLGVTGRLDFARFAVGQRSLWVMFVEAGLGRQQIAWRGGEFVERNDTHIGMGWLLDHRGNRMRLLPAVGWHVSWRLTAAPSDDAAHLTQALCRGKDCVAPQPDGDYDTGLLVSSGLMVSW